MSPLNAQAVVGLAGLGVAFAVLYPTLLTKLSRTLISPYGRADLRRRAYAAIIDGLIAVSIGALAFTLGSVPLVLASAAYVVFRDAMNGRSPGKFLMGLMVVKVQTGQPASIVDSTARNLMFLIPGVNLAAVFLETRTLVRDGQGQRLGDRIAMTQVVDGFGAKELTKTFDDLVAAITAAGGLPEKRPREAPERRHKAA